MTVPAVSLPARSLDAIELPGSSSKVLEGEDERSYSTSTDVLFDFGKAELKPEAVTELQAVVADLKARFPEGEITVEGHTDSVGSAPTTRTSRSAGPRQCPTSSPPRVESTPVGSPSPASARRCRWPPTTRPTPPLRPRTGGW